MNRSDAIPHVTYVVDDAGSGRRLGADITAVIRNADGSSYSSQLIYNQPRYASVLIGWDNYRSDTPLFVAVHSYLDVRLTDDEATSLALDYVGKLGLTAREPDYLIR